MAHALPGYDGACRHVHGHSFRLEVCVRGVPIHQPGHPKDGMVMDFKQLKDLVQSAFIQHYDHALALPVTVDAGILEAMEAHFGKVIRLAFQPTCENLIGLIVKSLKPLMPSGIELWSVRLSETASSFAEWYASDEQ